jgi:hypothetical protein
MTVKTRNTGNSSRVGVSGRIAICDIDTVSKPNDQMVRLRRESFVTNRMPPRMPSRRQWFRHPVVEEDLAVDAHLQQHER